jgi:hypothetical protein
MSVTRVQLVGNVSTGASFAGIVTATSFSGSGANLTGIATTENVRTNSLVVSGVSTLGTVVVGGATTQLIVTGNARVTGILTVGSASITLNGITDTINVGTGLTLSSGGINITGVITATSFVGTLTGAATSTTNIPNLTGAITSVNTTTSLGSFSSANLATALTDETGSGANVFATSPTLVTPALGTPTSGILTSCTVDGTDVVGFRNIPQNSQSAAYTLVLADNGKHIFHPVGDNTARTFTIPANSSVAYPIGTALTFINMAAAAVTIAITTDTLTLSPAGTAGSRTLAQYGSATCIKITSTSWLISGSGLT